MWRGVYSLIFTALHGMQTRSSDENSYHPSVCPSICPSVCHTRVLWQNGRKICPDLYIIRKNIYPSFLRRRMVGGGRPLLPEILGQPTPIRAKSPFFNRYSLVALQPLHPAKKVQLTLIGSPYALSNEPNMIVVRCPEVRQRGPQKRKTADFH